LGAAITKSQAPAEIAISWPQALSWRARKHQLHRLAPRKAMLDVASRTCGLHAQVMSSAELSLWARVDGVKLGDVQRFLWTDRALVKSWMVRGTLHLLPSSDFPLWQAALSTYDHYLKPYWLRNFGVTHDDMNRLISAIAQALDGEMLTRNELAARVGDITGSADLGNKLLESWGVLLKPATYLGHVCFAPNAGQNVRFTRPDKWIADYRAVEPEKALAETTRRYFAMNGPATAEEFAHWAGVRPAQAKTRINALRDVLATVDVEGNNAYVLREDVKGLARSEPDDTVRLLPAFDQYVISASREAANYLPKAVPRSVVYRAQGWISPVLLVGGRMDGIWSHTKTAKGTGVAVSPFGRLTKKVRLAAESEADRLAAYFGKPVDFRIEKA
jgi:hypothetical protein